MVSSWELVPNCLIHQNCMPLSTPNSLCSFYQCWNVSLTVAHWKPMASNSLLTLWHYWLQQLFLLCFYAVFRLGDNKTVEAENTCKLKTDQESINPVAHIPLADVSTSYVGNTQLARRWRLVYVSPPSSQLANAPHTTCFQLLLVGPTSARRMCAMWEGNLLRRGPPSKSIVILVSTRCHQFPSLPMSH